jgi:hypothetical protein
LYPLVRTQISFDGPFPLRQTTTTGTDYSHISDSVKAKKYCHRFRFSTQEATEYFRRLPSRTAQYVYVNKHFVSPSQTKPTGDYLNYPTLSSVTNLQKHTVINSGCNNHMTRKATITILFNKVRLGHAP